jgi:hypothetical protein
MTTLAPDEVSVLTPYPGGRTQYRACAVQGCPNVYAANICGYEQDTCPDHRDLTYPVIHKDKIGKHQNRWQPMVIVSDPLPISDGGFQPGVPFDMLDFTYMLMEGALTVGLKGKHQGLIYEVTGENEITRADGVRLRGTSKHCLEEVRDEYTTSDDKTKS